MIRIGTSGWQYDDWRPSFYPVGLARDRWLGRYVECFDTVEINNTFYRLPSQATVDRWAQALPQGFLAAIKVSRYLTHVRRLRDPQDPVALLLERVAPLRERGLLGPVLLQLPPNMPARPEDLERTLSAFPPDVRVAVEPRDRSWFRKATREVLIDHRAALVWSDRNGRSVGPLWRTTSWCYLRLHHGRLDWAYQDRDLRRWARRLRECPDAFVFTNNDPGAAAVRDARRLQALTT
ncbi:MAG TPA: DUF72 domain-containing protein [Sporichthyaceae bacterium]|jgi:uncharacterized protein YecE (DUF72 family)|nr:DUF72 domain-containing protein [Sporichthyaceae bacterium]